MESCNPARALPLPAPRLAMQRRTSSSSSEASRVSNLSHISEEQFVFSPLNTPAGENPPSRAMTSGATSNISAARHGLLLGKEINTRPHDPAKVSAPKENPGIITNSKTNPITIELPGERTDPVSATSSKPPTPLSTRGDIPGGYFPLHEDPQSRVRIPHPFHPDTEMSRRQPHQGVAECSKSGSNSPSLSTTNTSEPARLLFPNLASSSFSPLTPLSSYNPIGAHDEVGLPLGKYYPSNWERRKGKAPQTRPSAPQPTAGAMRSEPQVPTYHGDQGHARPGSEAKRRLQQYQRDMVAQASMAARALLAKNTSAATSPQDVASPPKSLLAATFLKSHKPLSPRLRPLGSPGPVTPMSLEGDSYMSLAPSVIADANAAGKGWHRTEARSPMQNALSI